ncbi:MAG: hypothetical protein A2Y12_20140 [Planctomycetes bacterium GWF2_42_9]|nr:MAG: hypothetical protein A2Y12_20140 [Planctomycetes bacterium GWF2_42_9]HAL45092.1 hypothetical protein [Phycisphaerales bacterium]
MKNLLIYSIVITGIFTILGCNKQQAKKQPVQAAQIQVQPDIKVLAVAQYVQKEGSRYITHQHFQIFSAPQAIMLSADEPYGRVVWSIENGVFNATKSEKAIDKDVFNLMTSEEVAQGLMNLYLASLGKIQIAETAETLDFDGKIYTLVAQNGQNVKFYKNKSTKYVDLVTVGQNKEGIYLFSGYNYLKLNQKEGQEAVYPSKVDIFLYRASYDKKMLGTMNCLAE